MKSSCLQAGLIHIPADTLAEAAAAGGQTGGWRAAAAAAAAGGGLDLKCEMCDLSRPARQGEVQPREQVGRQRCEEREGHYDVRHLPLGTELAEGAEQPAPPVLGWRNSRVSWRAQRFSRVYLLTLRWVRPRECRGSRTGGRWGAYTFRAGALLPQPLHVRQRGRLRRHGGLPWATPAHKVVRPPRDMTPAGTAVAWSVLLGQTVGVQLQQLAGRTFPQSPDAGHGLGSPTG